MLGPVCGLPETSGHPEFALLRGLLLLESGVTPSWLEGWRGKDPLAERRMRCLKQDKPYRCFKEAT